MLATMYDSRTVHSREVLARLVEAFGDKVFHTVDRPHRAVPGDDGRGRADHDLRDRRRAAPTPTGSSPGRCSHDARARDRRRRGRASPASRTPTRRPGRGYAGCGRPPARTSGRERHDEKITVYVSQDELVALEQARLVLRAEHGVAVDRGRLVREAVAEMLIDLEAHGADSVVVEPAAPVALTGVPPLIDYASDFRLAPGSDYRAGVSEETALPVTAEDAGTAGGFRVDLGDLFEGPFDLLLGLISKHKLDVTEIALSQGHRRVHRAHQGQGPGVGPRPGHRVPRRRRDPARPQGRPAAAQRRGRGRGGPRAARGARPALRPAAAVPRVQAGRRGVRRPDGRRGRPVRPRRSRSSRSFAGLLPEVLLGLGPQEFAALAARALTPRPVPMVSVDHLHAPQVSVREQAAILVDRAAPRAHRDVPDPDRRLRRAPSSWSRGSSPCSSCTARAPWSFEQVDPLGELHIRWTGTDEGDVEVPDEFDEEVVARATTRRRRTPTRDDDASPPTYRTTPRSTCGRRAPMTTPDEQPVEREDDGVPLRTALEAILMVVDEPVGEVTLAQVARAAHRGGRRRRCGLSRRSTTSRAAASSCARWPAGGGSTPGPSARGVRRAVRARRAAGPADPGRARDAGRGRLPAAGQPRRGSPRCAA